MELSHLRCSSKRSHWAPSLVNTVCEDQVCARRFRLEANFGSRPPVPVTCPLVGFLRQREPLSLIPLGLCWSPGRGVKVCCYLLKGKQTNKQTNPNKQKKRNKNLGRTKLLGSGFRVRAPFHLQNKSPATVPRGLAWFRLRSPRPAR